MNKSKVRIGFVVNPYAGVGGPIANKGSDSPDVQKRAQAGLLELTACTRAKIFLRHLRQHLTDPGALEWLVAPGVMGEAHLAEFDFHSVVVEISLPQHTAAEHTKEVVRLLQQQGMDLLVFVGGDGTARDICSVIKQEQLVLGVPAGVKMHSGVFAINPQSAAELVAKWLAGALVEVGYHEVRDIDETAFRNGLVKSAYYGEMLTPLESHLIQNVKQGGFEVEELVLMDMAEYLSEKLPQNSMLILGPGSTTYHVAKNWGVQTTLLGVDVLLDRQLVAADVDANTIELYIQKHDGPCFILVTAIGGQGHVIGRGNQQISASVLRKIGRDHFWVVATKTKLRSLNGGALLIDSGDTELDRAWSGYTPVICGYNQIVSYRLGIDNVV